MHVSQQEISDLRLRFRAHFDEGQKAEYVRVCGVRFRITVELLILAIILYSGGYFNLLNEYWKLMLFPAIYLSAKGIFHKQELRRAKQIQIQGEGAQ